MKVLLAIDPGASGGLAWRDGTGAICAMKMPETPSDILAAISDLGANFCVIENVGGYQPGNSGPAAATFARHVGNLEMALLALKIPHKYVAPTTWMNAVCPTRARLTKGEKIGLDPEALRSKLSKAKQQRKNDIKTEMQRRYPGMRITLATADALGILTYLMEDHELLETPF